MAIMFEENLRTASVENVAAKMMLAARTAPKGRGIDNLVIALAKKDDIKNIVHEMQRLSQLSAAPIMAQTLVRDAANVALADAVVLLGTKIAPLGLPECGICGFATCQEKNQHPNFPCAFNTGDLGIAIGAAASIAMDHRVDNRIMRSIGKAVLSLQLLGADVKICYGIPLSATGKNLFFDRK